MNSGTKIRTALFAIACVNQSIVSIGDVDLGNETANLIYRVISLACTIISGAFALYFNNDFTEAAAVGTGITRQMKAELKEDYNGETFFDEEIEPVEFIDDDSEELDVEVLCAKGEE